jgi:uncharacterized RDD family membrane protein YckC
MRSAELQLEPFDFPAEASAEDARAALKQQVAERLAAHRTRRRNSASANLVAIADPAPAPTNKPAPKPPRTRKNNIANAVAERYAQSQSYRDFLAAEAERAIAEANATAAIAARTAEAVTVAQQQLLAELDHWNDQDSSVDAAGTSSKRGAKPVELADELESSAASEGLHLNPSGSTMPETGAATGPVIRSVAPGLTVRLYEDVGLRVREAQPATAARPRDPQYDSQDDEEAFALDDEIAFRQTPVFAEPAGPPVAIPANLIEFPRQLVAPRKSRPRIAEGPLREEADTTPALAQLRIFEVEPAQIATAPALEVESPTPVWSSIHLDAAPAEAPVEVPEPQTWQPLHTAQLGLRAMAAAVDACILGTAFLAAVSAFAWWTAELPSLPVAAVAALGTLLVLFILYHLLFFTFSDSTPGMRYARIGLCTFSDENPTRAAMRRRTWAILLAACPLGIGLLWALVDDEGLGWHDRISRMYQRGY